MFARAGLLMSTAVLIVSLVACGGGEDEGFTSSLRSSDAPAGDVSESEADFEYAEDAADAGDATASSISTSSWDRKVIRSGELDLVVSDVSSASRHARDLVADHGGFQASSSARTLSDSDEYADLAFEVPADVFDRVMNELRDSSHVVRVDHESTSSQDVTEEYVDLSSRLGNLESTEQRFVELLEDAHSISDVLSVESEISRVRGEIEQIKGRLNYLEQRTDYSRIYVSLVQEEDPISVAGHQFTPGETAREAWNASMEFVGTLGNAAITVVVFFWWAWPLIGLGLLGISRYRRRRQIEQPAT